jgi:hypothetical protein
MNNSTMNTADQYITGLRFRLVTPAIDNPLKVVQAVSSPLPWHASRIRQAVARCYDILLLPVITLLVFTGAYGFSLCYHQYVLSDHPISEESNGVSDFVITASIYDEMYSEGPPPFLARRLVCDHSTSKSFLGLGQLLHDRFAVDLVVSRRVRNGDPGIGNADNLTLAEITDLLSLKYNIFCDRSSRRVLISEKILE